MLAVLEQSATNLRPADDLDRVGGLVQTAGMRWTVDLTRPLGHRIRDVTVGGAPLHLSRSYRVMTNGGLLQGTHRYVWFAQGRDIERDELPFAVMLEQGLRAMGRVSAPAPGDITLIR
jgi:5'-nucleotidase/UDP-sugar diphosphatase